MSSFKQGLADALKNTEAPSADAPAPQPKPRKELPAGASGYRRALGRTLDGEPAARAPTPTAPQLTAALERAWKAHTDIALGAAVGRARKAIAPPKKTATSAAPVTRTPSPSAPTTIPLPPVTDAAFFMTFAVGRVPDDRAQKSAAGVRVVADLTLDRAAKIAGKTVRAGTRVQLFAARDDAAWKAFTKNAKPTQADADRALADAKKSVAHLTPSKA